MSFNVQDWSRKYDQTKREIQSCRQQERSFTSTEQKAVETTLDTLESQLRMMSSAPMDYQVSSSEVSRRKVLLRNLRTQMAKATKRTPVMPMGTGGVKSTGTSGAKGTSSSSSSSASTPVTNPMLASTSGLALRQEQIIRQQDDMLLDIAEGVDRLRDKALVINNEVKTQGKLMDDLEANVEQGIEGLQQEAEHAKQVREKSATFKLYVCLLLEFCLLLLLIFIAFVH